MQVSYSRIDRFAQFPPVVADHPVRGLPPRPSRSG